MPYSNQSDTQHSLSFRVSRVVKLLRHHRGQAGSSTGWGNAIYQAGSNQPAPTTRCTTEVPAPSFLAMQVCPCCGFQVKIANSPYTG